MKKKLISAMIYIYIAVVVGVVASAETITGLGVAFPIQKFKGCDYWSADLDGMDKGRNDSVNPFEDFPRLRGVQGTIKIRNIGYSGFVFGADLDIGSTKVKDWETKFLDFSFDLAFGYAVVDADRFTLIPSVILGVHHQKGDAAQYFKNYDTGFKWIEYGTERYTAFEVGVDLFANFKIGDCFGLFAACKFMFNVGNLRDKYDIYGREWTDRWHKTTALVVKPSVGMSFTF